MEYREILSFLEIARTRSFGKAATHLALTQPALSRHIAKLERELSVTLFDREPEIKLTMQGEEFLQKAIRLKDAYMEAMNFHGDKDESEIHGEYRISTGSTVAACVLPGLITSLRKKSPEVRFRVFEGDAAHTTDSVMWGDVDLGILPDRAFRTKLPTGMQSRYFFSDTIVPVVGIKHPLSRKEIPLMDDLIQTPFVMFHSASSIRRTAEEQLRKADLHLKIEPVMELRSIESVRAAIEEGLGVGFLSDLYLSRRLKVLNFPQLTERRNFHFYFRDTYKTGLGPLMDAMEDSYSRLFKENKLPP